jgi:CRISP-associated protein Cas1
VPPEFQVETRSRRPPGDPFNALLSFGYVLVGNELQALLDGMGFDPYLGFFHAVDYGRPSLALDLVEEFRTAIVDRCAVSLLNRRVLAAADFAGDPGRGVFLSGAGKKRFFIAWEEELARAFAADGEETSFRRLFRRQAERLARAVVDGGGYRAFRLPC